MGCSIYHYRRNAISKEIYFQCLYNEKVIKAFPKVESFIEIMHLLRIYFYLRYVNKIIITDVNPVEYIENTSP